MVRITVGAGAALSTPLEEVATVVVVTVCVVEYVDGAWVCADASAAAAEKITTRHSFFTVFLNLGEIEMANHLYGAG
jgi:hypothetical protein